MSITLNDFFIVILSLALVYRLFTLITNFIKYASFRQYAIETGLYENEMDKLVLYITKKNYDIENYNKEQYCTKIVLDDFMTKILVSFFTVIILFLTILLNF